MRLRVGSARMVAQAQMGKTIAAELAEIQVMVDSLLSDKEIRPAR